MSGGYADNYCSGRQLAVVGLGTFGLREGFEYIRREPRGGGGRGGLKLPTPLWRRMSGSYADTCYGVCPET